MQSESNKTENADGVDVPQDDDELDVDPDQTVVLAEDTFSDPDISMEVNVEKLVAELEGADDDDAHRKAEIRRRLEELADDGSFEDTYAIDL